MTVEQIDLRKILSQMLADNGINQNTILDFTKEVINEKADKSVKNTIANTNLDTLVKNIIEKEISKMVQVAVKDIVWNHLNKLQISVEVNNLSDKTMSYTKVTTV